MGATFQRIDVTFDRYRPESIKAGTRTKRKKGKRPVRRQLEIESVPLPFDWSNFMALEDNQADLALLLSNYLIDHSPSGQTMVVAGGFSEATIVKSSDPTLDLSMLEADHEEAGTRLICSVFMLIWSQWLCRYAIPMSLCCCSLTMTKWDVRIC